MPQTFNVGSRSRFVTLVAWLFIVLSALACAWAVIANATSSSWLAELAGRGDSLPALSRLVLRRLPWVLSAAAALSLGTLACAVGVLRRVEWARRLFIGLLGLAIGVDLAGLWLQQDLARVLADAALGPAGLPQHAAAVLGGVLAAARVLAGVLTVAAGLALAGVIRRLMTPAVRQEFA